VANDYNVDYRARGHRYELTRGDDSCTGTPVSVHGRRVLIGPGSSLVFQLIEFGKGENNVDCKENFREKRWR